MKIDLLYPRTRHLRIAFCLMALLTIKTTIAQPPTAYLGCYEDRLDSSLDIHLPYNPSGLTAQDCISACSQNGWLFAGLRSG
jgi:hypothetical protein